MGQFQYKRMMRDRLSYDVIIIGAGFFGCMIALHFRRQGKRVLVIEKEDDILLHASYVNQARIHNGYHYPRSLLTAQRSHDNYEHFLQHFPSCVDNRYIMIYAIAKGSKTSVQDFKIFCKKIGSPLIPAPIYIQHFFNPELVEEAFLVNECVYNAAKLRDILRSQLQEADVQLILNCTVQKVAQGKVYTGVEWIHGRRIINCTYAGINVLLKNSGLPELPLKFEQTQMPLVQLPPTFASYGITIMDGNYFGLMPFPEKQLHTIHHVKYTPDPKSTPKVMIDDVVRYIPGLHPTYKESLFEIKTILHESEKTDSRPILYRKNYHLQGFDVVLGSKIDNVYDVLKHIDHPWAKGLNIV
jgi:glycine/D-amino acid oxidase-like deaminating enzyme